MIHQRSSLFRREVTERRSERLHGAVSIAVPPSWQVIGGVLLVALVATIVFLSFASYARVVSVTGTVALDRGVATIVPTRGGVVADVAVAEGQSVTAGQPLVKVRSEEDMAGGITAPMRIRAALEEQDKRLAAQQGLVLRAAASDQRRLRAEMIGARGELTDLDQQVADQTRLLEVAVEDYRDAQSIAGKGFLSKRDLEVREAAVLSRRQQLGQLRQLQSSKRAAYLGDEQAIAQSGATAQAQVANTQSGRAGLVQQIAQADQMRGYMLTSPVDGLVTALTARAGQPAITDQPLLTIVPRSATTRVELYIPTSAVGFVTKGQEVRLAIDAFPYDRFGTVAGRIETLSATAIPKAAGAATVPVYLAVVSLPQPWVVAFGRKQHLAPGMTLTARIITERRSLIEWLFEPLFAVRNR